MKKRWRHFWETTSIKHKMNYLIGMLISFVIVLSMFELLILRYALVDFHDIMKGNLDTYELEDALEEEIAQFSTYVRETSSGNKQELIRALRIPKIE